jgi:hypothetical protein
MQSTADPYPASVESRPTDGKGELERIRYQIKAILEALADDATQWYHDAPTTGTFKIGIVGSNETAVTIDNKTSTGSILLLNDNGTLMHQFSDGGGIILNEQGNAVDIRMEGDTITNLFFLQGSGDAIGIGTSSPSGILHAKRTIGSSTAVGRFEAAVGGYTSTTLIAENTLAAATTFHLFECASDSDGDAGGRVVHFRVRGDGSVALGPTVSAHSAILHVQGLTGTSVGAIINNGTSTGNILSAQDNGTDVLLVADGGATSISATAGGSSTALVVDNKTSTGHILVLRDNGTTFHQFSDGGTVIFNENGDPAADFRVEGDTQTNLIFVDASADQIYFGGTTPGAGTFTYSSGGGIQLGQPTGGDKGSGTANFAADIYKNNSAYANPDYVLEHWVTGKVEKFKNNPGATDYPGVMPLDQLEEYIRKHLDLPRVKSMYVEGGGQGIFARGDIALEKIEELAVYIVEIHKRLKTLEAA